MSITNTSAPTPSVLTTDLSKHTALVTGGTGGIGAATCKALAALGCTIALHFHKNEDAATSLRAELESMGVRAHAFQADLSGYEGVCSWMLHVVILYDVIVCLAKRGL